MSATTTDGRPRSASIVGWARLPAITTRTALLAIVVAAALIRLGGAWAGTPCVVSTDTEVATEAAAEGRCVSYNDSPTYVTDAEHNADGRWFTTRDVARDRTVPTALHAPGFSVLLTPLIAVGIDSYEGLRVAVALLGTATVGLVFLLGRRLGGDPVGLVAAGLAAVHPLVWINDVLVMPEGLFGAVVAGVALIAYRFHDEPTLARAAVFGAAVGAATLWRNEALATLAFVAVPLALGRRDLAVPQRIGRLAAIGAATALVLAPWVSYNHSRFDRWALTNGVGAGLRIGTCDETFYNDTLLGLRSVDCLALSNVEIGAESDEVRSSAIYQRDALDHYRDNLGRAPTVVLARVARFWGVWRPFETVRLDDAIEQRGAQRAQIGIVVGWALLPLSAYGAVVLWRRRVPLSPLLGWVATSTLLAAANQPLQRFRIGGDVALVVLAAVGLVAALRLPSVRRLLGLDPAAPAPTVG